MKFAYTILPEAEETASLNLILEVSHHEELAFHKKGELDVDFSTVHVGLSLFDHKKMKYGHKTMDLKVSIPIRDVNTPKWDFSKHWPWCRFETSELRKAYTFLRRVSSHIINSAIEALPMAGFEGFTDAFDVTLDVPKDLRRFESYRRAILIRGH